MDEDNEHRDRNIIAKEGEELERYLKEYNVADLYYCRRCGMYSDQFARHQIHSLTWWPPLGMRG